MHLFELTFIQVHNYFTWRLTVHDDYFVQRSRSAGETQRPTSARSVLGSFSNLLITVEAEIFAGLKAKANFLTLCGLVADKVSNMFRLQPPDLLWSLARFSSVRFAGSMRRKIIYYMTALANNILGPSHPASLLLELVQHSGELGTPFSNIVTFMRDIMIRIAGPSSLRVVRLDLELIGMLIAENDDFYYVRDVIHDLLLRYEKTLGRDDYLCRLISGQLAFLHHVHDFDVEAEKIYLEVLSFDAYHGDDHNQHLVVTADAERGLGQVYESMQKFGDAEKRFKRTQSLLEESFGLEDEDAQMCSVHAESMREKQEQSKNSRIESEDYERNQQRLGQEYADNVISSLAKGLSKVTLEEPDDHIQHDEPWNANLTVAQDTNEEESDDDDDVDTNTKGCHPEAVEPAPTTISETANVTGKVFAGHMGSESLLPLQSRSAQVLNDGVGDRAIFEQGQAEFGLAKMDTFGHGQGESAAFPSMISADPQVWINALPRLGSDRDFECSVQPEPANGEAFGSSSQNILGDARENPATSQPMGWENPIKWNEAVDFTGLMSSNEVTDFDSYFHQYSNQQQQHRAFVTSSEAADFTGLMSSNKATDFDSHFHQYSNQQQQHQAFVSPNEAAGFNGLTTSNYAMDSTGFTTSSEPMNFAKHMTANDTMDLTRIMTSTEATGFTGFGASNDAMGVDGFTVRNEAMDFTGLETLNEATNFNEFMTSTEAPNLTEIMTSDEAMDFLEFVDWEKSDERHVEWIHEGKAHG
jgi:hypothetical protein